jgi:predicted TIM-barrel fold metal-dependent hydrolase
MISGMSFDRVTVSLPAEVRQAAQRFAQEAGVPFSAVVADALESWLRGRLVDTWLAEHEAEFGAFDEAELEEIAAEAGVPYVPPANARTVA